MELITYYNLTFYFHWLFSMVSLLIATITGTYIAHIVNMKVGPIGLLQLKYILLLSVLVYSLLAFIDNKTL